MTPLFIMIKFLPSPHAKEAKIPAFPSIASPQHQTIKPVSKSPVSFPN